MRMRKRNRLMVPLLLNVLLVTGTRADNNVGGVPLPENAKVSVVPSNAPLNHRRFAGAWIGAWEDVIHHILVVEDIRTDGQAKVIYAVGDNPWAKTVKAWHRRVATITGDELTISGPFTVSYRLYGPDALLASWQRGSGRALAKMTKVELTDLTRGGLDVPWASSQPEFPLVETDLFEDGKPIRLEVVIYKPSGNGPFPLFVFNHGATADGRVPERFHETWSSFTLANVFVTKGWMVAFPQRRGKGRSEGQYDEGFASDRRQGYSCDPIRSAKGAERGLADIDAAIRALRRRPDVNEAPMLMGGQSRGGLLSIIYAARHPYQILGVINFAGGWLAEACKSAALVNKSLFGWGARYTRPTLWLYGRNDVTFTIEHSRANFEAFRQAGGQGLFFDLSVPSPMGGHFLMLWPEQWYPRVEEYLGILKE
jgi:pimeloyl-ACP methyl ester carboxylesterase